MKNQSSLIKLALLAVAALALVSFPLVAPNRYIVHIINMAGLYILISLGLNLAM